MVRFLWHFLVFACCSIGIRSGGCPERSFLGCVLRLKAQRVPFERNMLDVVFNLESEAKLKRTCNAYSNVMSCFRDKINDCGDEKQRRMLNEVGKMIMFLCSPFSVERQRRLLSHSRCVGAILRQPAKTGCELRDYHYGKQFLDCRRICSKRPTDFICMMKTWISEQNICTVRGIEHNCGNDAAHFYVEMQTTVFEPLFPVICEYEDKAIMATTIRSIVIGTVTSAPHHSNKTKPLSQLPKIISIQGRNSTPIPTNWVTVIPKKKTSKSSFSNFTAELLATSRPKTSSVSSRPVTVLSLFQRLFPISSSLPEKIKSIIGTKFSGLNYGNQLTNTVKNGYSDGHLNITEPNSTTPTEDIKWEVTPLVEPPTAEANVFHRNTIHSTKFNKTIRQNEKTVTVLTTSTSKIGIKSDTAERPSSAHAQLSTRRKWRPWYLIGGVIPAASSSS